MSEQRKALLGGVLAGLSVLAGALTDPATTALAEISDGQWVAAVIAALTAWAGVYAVPNDPPGRHAAR